MKDSTKANIALATGVIVGILILFYGLMSTDFKLKQSELTIQTLKEKLATYEQTAKQSAAWGEEFSDEGFRIRGSAPDNRIVISFKQRISDKSEYYHGLGELAEKQEWYDQMKIHKSVSPIAKRMFEINGITIVGIQDYEIALTRADAFTWYELRTNVINAVKGIVSPGKG